MDLMRLGDTANKVSRTDLSPAVGVGAISYRARYVGRDICQCGLGQREVRLQQTGD